MFSAIANIFIAIGMKLRIWGAGLWALLVLLGAGLITLFRPGALKDKFAKLFAAPATQIRVFAFLRAFIPNLSLSRVIMKAYENTGTAVVTRHDDVLDVLNRDADFEVVYGPRMRKLTAGENFFLGMQPGWDYTRDTSAMRLAARQTDVADFILPRATELAENIVAAAGGKIDIVPELTLQIPWDMTDTYFGVGGSRPIMQNWTTTLFWYLFEDLPANPELDVKAMEAAAGLRDYLDDAIRARKAKPNNNNDILNRCLALQSADTPGMSDLGIRNNLLGLLIGAIPTISKACCLALDELLRRPEALHSAHLAARNGDDSLLANHIWEALRFNPHNPVVYRRATHDTIVAPGTLRRMRVKKGQMVFAATFSATFDPMAIKSPNSFRTDRPWEDYIIWGYGMHTCFGAAINRAIIPAILKPLLAQKNLRRAEGSAGEIDNGGTPHPQHFHLVFDI